jgi:hypothetical protein
LENEYHVQEDEACYDTFATGVCVGGFVVEIMFYSFQVRLFFFSFFFYLVSAQSF